MIDLNESFERHNEEFLHFERIEGPRHARPDICAMLILHDLDPKPRAAVSAATHDEIWLDFDCEVVAKTITDEQVRDLARCGIRYDDDHNSFCMFA